MWIFKRVIDIQEFLGKRRSGGLQTGFVPTMGALHPGHLRLIEESKRKTDITISSVFVNPTQFNDKKDLERYPRTISDDITALFNSGCDVLFLPDVEDIYPLNFSGKHFDLGELETAFEGHFRTGHFQGVCQVVNRLFEIIMPDQVFFGQKDYQQCMVIKRLLEITPAFHGIDMNIVPTLREKTGLAMSSRNMLLTIDQKKLAAEIHATLIFLKQNLEKGNLSDLLQKATKRLTIAGFKVDYVAIANARTLKPVEQWDGHEPLVALVAAFLGQVRLIDNMILTD